MKIVIAAFLSVVVIVCIVAIGTLSRIQGRQDLAWQLLSTCVTSGETPGTCTLSYTYGDGQPITILVKNELIFQMKD
jgi:hypothetical protein